MAMIEVEDLRKSYGSFQALLGVNFSVDQGEILGFLGPNGAGKSTTMKILTGSLEPSGGSARIDGRDVVRDSLALRRRIGYLPENTPLYDDLKVRQYLRHCGRLRGLGGKRLSERVEELIARTALTPKANAIIGTLSKGYRQRVGLSQALLHEPDIVVLDEPTVGLDPNQVVDVRELIRSVGSKATVILCSHILSEVEATASRVVIINGGTIVAEGTPQSLGAQAGGGRLELQLLGAPQDMAQRLGKLSGVQSVSTPEGSGLTEGLSFELDVSGDPYALAPEVQRIADGAGARIAALTPRGASLEDAFRKLTQVERS